MGKLWELLQRHIDAAPYPPSERQVAAKLQVSPTTLANWREPKKLPSRENLQAIADLVGVRYSVVLDAALFDTGYHEEARVLPMRPRPITTIQAELDAAEVDLSEFEELELAGRDAERKREELRGRVRTLEAELSASRRVTDEAGSVAEL
jgi:transcriptional regulator with XRE-family HTH domain